MSTEQPPLEQLAAWEEGDVSYYLHGTPRGPSGRVIVLTAVGPDYEHRWLVLPQGKSSDDLAATWTSASDHDKTALAENLLRRGMAG
ncbi:MAG: hypothetical protein JSW43_01505 [Gemmatimonadota bacterium]|nr:MAG: hypothetical protein JSW43_01505 [Gemmatimonadota bacterium]